MQQFSEIQRALCYIFDNIYSLSIHGQYQTIMNSSIRACRAVIIMFNKDQTETDNQFAKDNIIRDLLAK